jgi:hypothetical protein
MSDRSSAERAPSTGASAIDASHSYPAAAASPDAVRQRANERVAERLREAAQLLGDQDANPFRVRAYRNAAGNIERLERDVRAIFDQGGIDALEEIDGVGPGVASAIAEMLVSGRWSLLERLRGQAEPELLFRVVPGIGPELAQRIHETLHVDTLEGLEIAAHDGRLASVPGVGPRRIAAIRAALGALLTRTRARRTSETGVPDLPPVDVLLDVDREYRDKAARDRLPTIVPRRFNPSGKARLPILHTRRGAWHFTVLFSNTARAHALQRTRDWVVVYCYNDGHEERQCTIVTEIAGPLAGRRVVRGREDECGAHYASEVATAAHSAAFG